MKKYLFVDKKHFILYIIIMLVEQIVIVSTSIFLQLLLDAIISVDVNTIYRLAVFASIYTLVIFILGVVHRYVAAKYHYKMMFKLKSDLFENILKFEIPYLKSENSSKYISIMNNDVKKIESDYFRSLFNIIQFGMMIFSAILVLFIVDPIIALIIILISISSSVIPLSFGKKLSRLQEKVMQSLADFNSKVKDFLEGFEVIKTYNTEANILSKFNIFNKKVRDNEFKYEKTDAVVYGLTLSFGIAGLRFIVFFLAAWFVFQGRLTAGGILAIVNLSGAMGLPMAQIAHEKTSFDGTEGIREKLEKILSYNNSLAKTRTYLKEFNNSISFENLSFSYDKNSLCLKNINYTFKKGGSYAIVGKSGSGKSTLLKLLMGYYDNYKGNILIDEIEMNNLGKRNLYSLFSIIFQKTFLWRIF